MSSVSLFLILLSLASASQDSPASTANSNYQPVLPTRARTMPHVPKRPATPSLAPAYQAQQAYDAKPTCKTAPTNVNSALAMARHANAYQATRAPTAKSTSTSVVCPHARTVAHAPSHSSTCSSAPVHQASPANIVTKHHKSVIHGHASTVANAKPLDTIQISLFALASQELQAVHVRPM